MRIRTGLITMTLLGALGVGISAPAAHAGKEGRRNTALVLGGVAFYGAVTNKPVIAGAAGAGAVYSYIRSRKSDRDHRDYRDYRGRRYDNRRDRRYDRRDRYSDYRNSGYGDSGYGNRDYWNSGYRNSDYRNSDYRSDYSGGYRGRRSDRGYDYNDRGFRRGERDCDD